MGMGDSGQNNVAGFLLKLNTEGRNMGVQKSKPSFKRVQECLSSLVKKRIQSLHGIYSSQSLSTAILSGSIKKCVSG